MTSTTQRDTRCWGLKLWLSLFFTQHRQQRWAWIRTEANIGRIRTGSECNFFENWRVRTGSDSENFCCFNV